MEEDFWLNRWKKREIGFHAKIANQFLVKHFGEVGVKGGRVFVPLCGKSLDLHWLLAQGYCVAGAELSRIAVEELFVELGVEPRIEAIGRMTRYSAERIEIFLGNIFELGRAELNDVDAIYDRAALVALPGEMRKKYVRHLLEITACAPQLLVCFEYDQSKKDGPPFSVSDEMVHGYYDGVYQVEFLEQQSMKIGSSAEVDAMEKVWKLQRNQSHCIPKPLNSSRRDQQEAATFLTTQQATSTLVSP